MASLGDLVVNLKANNSNFNRGMKQSQSRMKQFGRAAKRLAIGAAFTAAAGAVVVFRKQLEELDAVAKLSARTGFGARDIQGFALAAELGGSSAAAAAKGMEQFTRRMGEAAGGTGTAATQLRKMGIDAKKLGDLQPTEQLRIVADAIAALPSKAEQANAAYQLFGRGGLELVNVLSQGSAEMQKMNDEVDAMGLALSADQLKAIEDVNDEWTKMTFAMSGAAATITADMAPALMDLLQLMGDLAKAVKDQAKWFSVLFKVGTGNIVGLTAEFPGGPDNAGLLGKFPGGPDNAGPLDDMNGRAKGTGFPLSEDDLGIDVSNKTAKRGIFDRIAGSKQMIKLQQDLLKIKLAVQAAAEKAKKAAEAQKQLDQIRVDDAIAAARDRVDETKPKSGGARFAGIATRGSSEALSSIFASRAAKVPEQALAEHKKANKTLDDLLAEQKKKQTDALLLQGAV